MKRLASAVVFLVVADAWGYAEEGPAPTPAVSSAQANGASAKASPAFEAETPDELRFARGTRLRLWLPGDRQVAGRLLETDGSTVTIDTGSGHPERFSRDGLLRVEYRTGGRNRLKGAAIGAAITGLAGFVACTVVWGKSDVYAEAEGFACGMASVVAAIPGGAVGFAIGTTGGHWHEVRRDGFSVAGAAPPRRATVALRLRVGR